MSEARPAVISSFASFQWPDFRSLFIATGLITFATRAFQVVLGYEVYALTRSTTALGVLGLVEAIPALSLSLYGGHVADRYDRRMILRATVGVLTICGLTLAVIQAIDPGRAQLYVLYGIVFIAGMAKGFAEPAASALEAQVVPWELLVNSSTLMASCWLTAGIVGPLFGGISFTFIGSVGTYLCVGSLYGIAWLAISNIAPKPIPAQPAHESTWDSVAIGVRYVWSDQILLGSMALDLFAVLFGGAIALLPVFAKEILYVDAVGLGMLNAAPTTGALLMMIWANRRPPVAHAGRNLFLAVAGFGVAMIVFGLSTSFALSMAALFMSGVFDGISVVIRRSILRLMSPDHLRGRIAAVSMIFIGASNELGAFESGLAATALGTARSVWLGGIVTLYIVAMAAVMAPKLRRLSLDPQRVRQRDAEVDAELDQAAAADGVMTLGRQDSTEPPLEF